MYYDYDYNVYNILFMKSNNINNKIKGSNKNKGIYFESKDIYSESKCCKDLTKDKVIKFIKCIFKDK